MGMGVIWQVTGVIFGIGLLGVGANFFARTGWYAVPLLLLAGVAVLVGQSELAAGLLAGGAVCGCLGLLFGRDACCARSGSSWLLIVLGVVALVIGNRIVSVGESLALLAIGLVPNIQNGWRWPTLPWWQLLLGLIFVSVGTGLVLLTTNTMTALCHLPVAAYAAVVLCPLLSLPIFWHGRRDVTSLRRSCVNLLTFGLGAGGLISGGLPLPRSIVAVGLPVLLGLGLIYWLITLIKAGKLSKA